MSLRDVDVSIGIDVDQNPLQQLNRRIDDFIQSLNNITTNGIDDFVNSINNAAGDINNLNNNVDDLNNNLNNLGGSGAGNLNNLNNGAGQATSGFGKLQGAIVAVGAAITAAIAVDKVVELGTSAIEAAAGARALNAQFEQVFEEVQDQATELINSMGEEFNMLPSRLQGPITSATSMFKGLGLDTQEALRMAERSVTAVADAAAFYDMSFEDANSALNSFIKGNYEGGEVIGLFANETQLAAFAIKEGIVGATKEWAALDEATKQATRLEYAENMQKLNKATGQAAREGKSYENMMGNLKQAWTDFLAKIGEPILDPVINALDWLGDVLQKIDPTPLMEFVSGGFEGIVQMAGYILAARDAIVEFGNSSGILDTVSAGFGIIGEYIDIFVNQFVAPLMPVAQEFIGTAMEYIHQVVGGVGDIFGSVGSIIDGLINNVVVPLFPVFQDIISTTFDIVSPILSVAGDLFGAISSVVRFLVEEIVIPLFPLIAGTISETWIVLKPILTAIADAFDDVASAIEWVVEKVGVVGSALKNLDVGGAIGKAVGWVMGDRAPGFDTGLGRVPYDDMPAYLHKDEAVLQADNADVLRDAGILKGDGRNPTIDLTPQQVQVEGPRNYRTEKVSNTTTSSTTVSAPINIIIQSSDNPQTTAQSVRDVIEEFFGDLPVIMEG